MEQEDVNTTSESQEVEPTIETVVEPTVEAGSKTDSALLLKSLQEEREKRRELEQVLASQQVQPEFDAFSDEGKAIKGELEALKESLVLKELHDKFPALKDKSDEFNEFRKDYPSVPLDKVSKLFLAEKDLLEVPMKRKGLEQASGGGRNVPATGPTPDEIANLRNTNYRKYLDMVKQGKIKFG